MSLRPHILSWSRTVVLIWVVVWMLAIPLVHVHPETDLHHGEAGHVHGGTAHTVFSPDLDGEFDPHHDSTHGFGHTSPNQMAVSEHPAHASEYVEFGFSFLNDSTDRKLSKALFLHSLIVESIATRIVISTLSVAEDRAFIPSLSFPTRDIPSRAPPFLHI
jgi:hypothetical protein